MVDATGSDLLALSIGEVPLALRLGEESLRKIAAQRYSPFYSANSSGFPVCSNEQAPRNGPARLQFELNGALLEFCEGEARLTGAMNEYTLDSFLRVTLSQLLLSARGMLLHAATVVRDGRAYVFMGQSGAGKSTIARGAPQGSALTDEVSLVRRHADGWRAHGTPFWGEFRAAGQNANYPLAGIFALQQAPHNRVEKLTSRQALRPLLSCALFFSAVSEDRQALLSVAMGLAASERMYRLEFRRELDFWGEVEKWN